MTTKRCEIKIEEMRYVGTHDERLTDCIVTHEERLDDSGKETEAIITAVVSALDALKRTIPALSRIDVSVRSADEGQW